jgi:hypothetical protein
MGAGGHADETTPAHPGGIFANYYIAGEAAKMSLGADIVDPNSTLKSVYGGKDFTDWTLALQTEF